MKVTRARMLAAAALLVACSGPPDAAPAPLAISRALPAGVVAMVGAQAIEQSVVARVAASRALTPALALDGGSSTPFWPALLALEESTEAPP